MNVEKSKSLILSEIKSHYKFKKDIEFASFLGIAPTTLASWYHRNSFDYDLVYSKCVDIDANWLLSGAGEMLRSNVTTLNQSGETSVSLRIPVHHDTCTQWINVADWFPESVSAMRYFGNSMLEYPKGCILLLKDVRDFRLIIWGRNYAVMTEECQIVKRIQRGSSPDYITAYSSNEETYSNGILIHEPMEIPVHLIHKLALVVGYIAK